MSRRRWERKSRHSRTRPLIDFSALEPRVLMSASHAMTAHSPAPKTHFPQLDAESVVTTPDRDLSISSLETIAPSLAAPTGYLPLTSIPILHSDPSATHKVYLDFVGAPAYTWGGYSVPATPAYTQDGDATTFTQPELNSIEQIWARVAEHFSPFNLDITTEDVGDYAANQNVRVLIGGDGSWYQAAGGVTYIGGYTINDPVHNFQTSNVFPGQLQDGDPKFVGEAASHELGHMFGLQHQSSWSGDTKTAEYRIDSSAESPIMGDSYYSNRGVWALGTDTLGPNDVQDDLAVISSNNFGYRPDDYGNDAADAYPITASGTTLSVSGVIAQTSDTDWFSFITQSGQVTLNVAPAAYDGMLDATLKIVNSSGVVVASADTASLGESLSLNLPAGAYDAVVGSHGSYGDVGQYTLTGTVANDPNFVAAPTNLTAARSAVGVSLNWTDNAGNETAELVERSTDNGASWSTVGTLAPNTTRYTDTSVVVGQSYAYRVIATNSVEQSEPSGNSAIGVTALAPGNFVATLVSATQVNLAWNSSAGATGYRIDESSDATHWTTFATLASSGTRFSATNLSPATQYYFRVIAMSSVGDSSPSTSAGALTIPANPASLTAAANSDTQIVLTWPSVSGATGYHIERLVNNIWTTVGNSVTTSYVDTNLLSAATYSYRVTAVDASGDSAPSPSMSATTLLVTPAPPRADAVSTSEIDLGWNYSAAAVGYKLEYEVNGSSTWNLLATITDPTNTSYSHTGLSAGTTYAYRLTVLGSTVNSAPSYSVSFPTLPIAPVSIGTQALDTDEIEVSWSSVMGASAYAVEQSADAGQAWTQIATTPSAVTSFTAIGLSSNQPYSYRVCAINSSGDSDFSPVAATTTLLPAPAAATATVVSASQITINWSSVGNSLGYQIDEFSRGADGFIAIASVSADTNNFSISNLAGGTNYQFRVHTLNAGGVGPSITATALTLPDAPQNFIATAVAPTKILLNWSAVTGADLYRIERSTDGVNFTPIAQISSQTPAYLDAAAEENTAYTYRVTASNSSGDSDDSLPATATATEANDIFAPTNLAAFVLSPSSVELAWTSSSPNVNAFSIGRSADNGETWTPIATTSSGDTNYIDSTVSRGITYQYRVQATNPWISSDYSNSTTVLTVPPDVTTAHAVAVTTSTVSLAWSDVPTETGFTVEQQIDGDWTKLATLAAGVTAYTIPNLSPGQVYQFRVTAMNSSGASDPSMALVAATIPAAPETLVAVAVTPTQINLAWDDVAGNNGYLIERSADAGVTWSTLANTTADVTQYDDSSAATGTAFTYRIRALNSAGQSDPSPVAVATATTDLAVLAPTQLTTWYDKGRVMLHWSADAANNTGFIIERSSDGGQTFTDLITIPAADATSYSDLTTTLGTAYVYQVIALNPWMHCNGSASVMVTPPANVADVEITSIAATRISLSWTDVPGATGFIIERSTDNTNFADIGTTGQGITAFDDPSVLSGTRYYYRVRASNAGGQSGTSIGVAVNVPVSSAPPPIVLPPSALGLFSQVPVRIPAEPIGPSQTADSQAVIIVASSSQLAAADVIDQTILHVIGDEISV